MNIKPIIITLLLATISLFISGINLYAETSSAATVVRYKPNENRTYELRVEALCNGDVYDGSYKLSKGLNIFNLKIEENKDFRVVAKNKNRVKSILHNGINIYNKRINASK